MNNALTKLCSRNALPHITVHGLRHKEANTARDKTIGELYSGTYVVYANVRVKDFMEFWVEEDIQSQVESSETYAAYSGIVRNHIIPVPGGKKMCEIPAMGGQEVRISIGHIIKSCWRITVCRTFAGIIINTFFKNVI